MRLHLEGDMPKVKKGHSKTRQPSKKACRKSLGSLEDVEEGNDQSRGSSSSKELVIYNPSNTSEDVVAITDHMGNHASGFSSLSTADPYSRVLPSVGAFTVQCAACFKWRFIPTKEKYEEIRERILEEPFICDRAREWRADISCDDPTDISQDGSRLWAIDKPNIAQPPPGWQRLLRIRGEGSTKFADIYYVSPSGKRLRSMVEIQKYLLQHPEYIRQGVNLSQFSFLTPKPLQESYVRKRAGLVTNSCNDDDLRLPRPLEPDEVNPLLWAGRAMSEELQMDAAGMPAPHFESPSYHSSMDVPLLPPPAKRKAPNKLSSKQCSPVYDQPQTRKEDTHQL